MHQPPQPFYGAPNELKRPYYSQTIWSRFLSSVARRQKLEPLPKTRQTEPQPRIPTTGEMSRDEIASLETFRLKPTAWPMDIAPKRQALPPIPNKPPKTVYRQEVISTQELITLALAQHERVCQEIPAAIDITRVNQIVLAFLPEYGMNPPTTFRTQAGHLIPIRVVSDLDDSTVRCISNLYDKEEDAWTR